MDYSEATVILPTLNEKYTIAKLINLISKTYQGINILVVDDNSTDGTIQIVKKISSRNKKVKLFVRTGREKGLTASIVDGILASRTKYVIVMDADMQHPYAAIKKVFERLKQGYDLVVAVRASVTNWALYRKIISRSLIYLGYLILLLNGKARCSDIFSGFFGVRRGLFIEVYKANKKRFVGNGYKVLFDFLKCVDKNDIKVAEVPYIFHTRKFGSSKAGIKQGIALFKSFLS